MTKRVPAVERTLRIFEVLSSQPREAFSVSELSERAEINISTCHSILLTLSEAGFLLRHEPMKTYTLGPALMELGATATEQYLGLPEARDAMVRLTRDFGLACTVGTRANEELLVVAHEAGPGIVPTTPQGFRSPLVPPFGILFMAWESDDRVQTWLSRLGEHADRTDFERYVEALARVRERGYVVSLGGTAAELAMEMANKLTRAGSSRERLGIAMELAEKLREDPYVFPSLSHHNRIGQDHVGVPIFGPDGSVVLTLTVIGHPGDILPKNVGRIAAALVKESQAIGRVIAGSSSTPAKAERMQSRQGRKLAVVK